MAIGLTALAPAGQAQEKISLVLDEIKEVKKEKSGSGTANYTIENGVLKFDFDALGRTGQATYQVLPPAGPITAFDDGTSLLFTPKGRFVVNQTRSTRLSIDSNIQTGEGTPCLLFGGLAQYNCDVQAMAQLAKGDVRRAVLEVQVTVADNSLGLVLVLDLLYYFRINALDDRISFLSSPCYTQPIDSYDDPELKPGCSPLLVFPSPGSNVMVPGEKIWLQAVLSYQLSTQDTAEVALELRDDKGNLIAAAKPRAAQKGLFAIGTGQKDDPYLVIDRADYLELNVDDPLRLNLPPDVSKLSLKAILRAPGGGKLLASSGAAEYPVSSAPIRVSLEGGEHSDFSETDKEFHPTDPAQYFLYGGVEYSQKDFPGAFRLRVSYRQPSPDDKATLELIEQYASGTAGRAFSVARKQVDDGKFYLVHRYEWAHNSYVRKGWDTVVYRARATLPSGQQFYSDPIVVPIEWIDAPGDASNLQKLAAESPVRLSRRVLWRIRHPGYTAVRCGSFFRYFGDPLKEDFKAEEFGQACVDLGSQESNDINDQVDVTPPATADSFCYSYAILGPDREKVTHAKVYPYCHRIEHRLLIPKGTTAAVDFGHGTMKNVNSAGSVEIKNTIGNKAIFSFLDGVSAPSAAGTGTLALEPRLRPRSLPAASSSPTRDLLGINLVWQFEPPIAQDGSFKADLVLPYSPADFPDAPGFDPGKLEILAFDPASGALSRLPSLVDPVARTVTAPIDGLAPVYTLAVAGPFSRGTLVAPALSAGGGSDAAIAAVNLENDDAAVQVEAYAGGLSKGSADIAPGAQLGANARQLAPSDAGETASWLLARAPSATAGTQALGSGRAYDFLDLQRTALAYSVFPEVLRSNLLSTEFHIVNPGGFDANGSLAVFSADGRTAGTFPIILPAKGKLALRAEDAVALGSSDFAGYAILTSDQPLNAAALLVAPSAIAGVNGQLPAQEGLRRVVPYLGGDPATLTLVNSGVAELSFTAAAFAEDGKAIAAAPLRITLAPGKLFRALLSDMFPPAAGSTLPRGTIIVDSSAPTLAGQLTVGNASAAGLWTLSLNREPLTSMVIPFLANKDGFVTNLNVASSGPAATATVTVAGSDGTTLGSARIGVAANGHIVSPISLWVNQARGLAKGYIRIDASQPVVAYAEIALAGATDTGVIPAQPAPAGASVTPPSPAIAVTPATLDFGSVTAGQTKDLDLTVRNTGAAALNVTAIAISSQRFTITSGAAPFTVAAGASQLVRVRFAPAAAASSETGTLRISSNDPSAPTLTINLSGAGAAASTPSIGVTPASLDFGNVAAGQTKDLTVTIRNTGASSLSVTAIASNNAVFTASGFTAPVTVSAGAAQSVTVRFAPTAAGAQSGTLRITSNDAANPAVTLALAGTGTSAAPVTDSVLKVDGGVFNGSVGYPTGVPTAYFLNRLTPPSYPATLKAVQVYFSRRDNGLTLGAPLNILATSTNGTYDAVPGAVAFDSFLTFAVPARTITSGDFFVGFMSQNPAGIFPADLDQSSPSQQRSYVSSDGANFLLLDSISPQVTGNLAIRAVISLGSGTASAPAIAATPATLDFGTVAAGQTKDLSLTVRNNGTAALTVAAVTSSNPRFVVTAPITTFQVGAGSFQGVTVRFSPTAAATETGTLTFTSNDPATPSTTISLTGTGTAGAAACLAPAAGLTGWWPGDGNANDQTGAIPGTQQGGVAYAGGKVGQAFDLDGSRYVQLGNPAALRLTNGVSIDAWINVRGVNSQVAGPPMGAIVAKWAQIFADQPDSDSYGLWVIQSGNALNLFSALHLTGASEPNIQGGIIPLNTWTHVAMTFDSVSGQYVLYVNGQAVASSVFRGTLYASNRNVQIGREDDFIGRLFNGLIDEPAVYSRALSAAEIQAIFNAGAAGKCK